MGLVVLGGLRVLGQRQQAREGGGREGKNIDTSSKKRKIKQCVTKKRDPINKHEENKGLQAVIHITV